LNSAHFDSAAFSALPPLLATDRLRRALDSAQDLSGSNALLVVSMDNIRWLTGFTGSTALLLIKNNDSVLIVDGRYTQQANDQLRLSGASARVVEARTQSLQMDQLSRELVGVNTCGFDSSEVTMSNFELIASQGSCSFVAVNGVVQQLRRIKTDAEIARMQLAAHATDMALTEVRSMLEDAMTCEISERDVRDELEYKMRRFGADGPSYETIVATGVNSVKPHHRPTSTVIREGDSVVIDVGGLVDGYHSDMTRTFLIGQVAPELAAIHDLVLLAQREGVLAVRPGVTGASVDEVCRGIITQAGYGSDFIHGTGHGVGLQIHEMPWVRTDFVEPLQCGEVVTVEPGVYRVGVGGVRIEDLILVTATSSQTLTLSQKESLCLPSPRTI
jgi:Xaa-Pro aminopeptidase